MTFFFAFQFLGGHAPPPLDTRLGVTWEFSHLGNLNYNTYRLSLEYEYQKYNHIVTLLNVQVTNYYKHINN